jgi:TRAP-type C4-dicarboxylate transport system substrate-binding protein
LTITNKIAAALATLGVVAGLSMTGAAAEELKLAHFSSPKHHLQVRFFEPLAKEMAAATNGKVTIGIYPAGKLGAGPKEQFNRVVDGVADIVFGLPGYTAVLFPKTLMIELPGVTASQEAATAGLWNAKPLIDDEFRRVKVLGLWTSASTILMMRDKPIHSPEDLKGLKIRVPSANAALAVEAWGATPVSLPVPAIYNALQTGVIDGILTDGSVIKNFKLFEVLKYYTTGVPSTVSAFFLLMNRDSWDGLDAGEQAALDKLTGPDFSLRASESYLKEAAEGLATVRDMADRTVIELTPEESAAFAALSAPAVSAAVEEMSTEHPDAKAIVAAMGKP